MKVAEYIEKCKKDIGWDSDAEQEWSNILHAVQFQERCAKDGILTYDRECNELRRKIQSLFYDYDTAFKKHKDIDDFKIAQVLSTLIKEKE